MNDNKQLAEQVAKLLGDYEIHTESGSDVLWLYKNKSMIARYESWPVTGMIIEEMKRLGWVVILNESHAHFRRIINDKPNALNLTVGSSHSQHGYHIAIAKAFVEAKAIIGKEG